MNLERRARAVLSLPNMFTAGAVHGLRWSLLGQLPLADWARLGHYIRHNLTSVLSRLFEYHARRVPKYLTLFESWTRSARVGLC